MVAPFRTMILVATLSTVPPFAAVAAQAQAPRGYVVQSHTPEGFKLPEGAGCDAEIERWQAVQANDYAGGNVDLSVYNQIQAEIARATAACATGQEAQAHKLVADSKRRHGYPQ